MSKNTKAKSKLAKKLAGSIVSLGISLLCILLGFVGLFLAYYSVRYSYYSSVNYSIPVYLIKDKLLWNLACFLLAVVLCALLNASFKRLGPHERKAGYIFLGICCVVYAVVCFIWVNALPYYPSGDQLYVTAAAHYHLEDYYIMLKKTGYLGKFPYQKGVTFFYEILFRLFGDFKLEAIYYFHIVLGVLAMIFGYLFIEETSHHSVAKILYPPFLLLCAPYIILTPYTYGDLPSISLGIMLCYVLVKYSRRLQLRYLLPACLLAIASLFMRMHTWVLLIAVAIGLLLVAIQKKKLQPILFALVILVSSFASTKALDYGYSVKSGYPMTKGAPMILTLAMGMQNNENGPGTYNNYQTDTLSKVDFDYDAASAIAKENLMGHLERFAKEPKYAQNFFKTKLLMQWIEPTFETLISTNSFDEDKEVPEWIQDIYYGSTHDVVVKVAERYQSIVYLGFLCCIPVVWKKRKENSSQWIPLIAILGGFLFSIIWESQCRYVLPYYIFMLLYVPDGLSAVAERLQQAWKTVRTKSKR